MGVEKKSFSLVKMPFAKLSLVFGGFAILGLMSFVFTNCSKANLPSTMELPQKSKSELVQALSKIHLANLENNFCSRSENYECSLKIFSSFGAHADLNQYPNCAMTSDGVKICPYIKLLEFDSSSAKKNCLENCNESYDYSEYDCHLRLSINLDGKFPLTERKQELNESIQLLHEACLSIQSGKGETNR